MSSNKLIIALLFIITLASHSQCVLYFPQKMSTTPDKPIVVDNFVLHGIIKHKKLRGDLDFNDLVDDIPTQKNYESPFPCYAPPLFYGLKCKSPRSLIGVKDTTIVYHVNQIGDTAIHCKALGMGYVTKEGCKWGWYDIGINPESATLRWGSSAGTPAIRCKGVPLGTAIKWSWGASSDKSAECGH
jgi:hypothetical protein